MSELGTGGQFRRALDEPALVGPEGAAATGHVWVGVSRPGKDGLVRLHVGPGKWLGLGRQQALALAEDLRKAAEGH